ncbi:glycoside hydrolase family 2 protein [Cylindrobasidium torrendii FP15055 ss-10]|uniref:Glycoside hydrolase family 2 protein n=1 Tax=Cylindrobasidium torrendii FP15055 ss-10 TaxID=1314674 RepID=A0A0D7B6Q5_9AGAR|nr:glycoside hydrolase family 2 protein [Cylindrobasidium torrendii FP15055 ss-10]
MGFSRSWLVNALAFGLLSVHAQLPKNGGLTDERPTYGSPEEAVYAPVEPKLKTQWTDGVAADPDNVWPEYPRPGLQRDNWLNLNGVWEFQSANSSDDISNVPVGTTLEQRILVPFCIESGLSGVAVQSPFSWYRTSFNIPESFEENVILHFAAVDYETTVFVNGEQVGSHTGGFDKFWFDVTEYVNKDSENELILFVYDPTDDFDEVIPLGKQRVVPSHIFYTPCSGVWQTVSIEAVPASEYITSIQLLAAADGSVTATIGTSSNSSSSSADISFYDPANPSSIIFSTSGSTNEAFTFTVDPAPSVWSPDTPVVYNVSVTVGDDVARSYTAFRTVERAEVNGVPRYLLNGQPIFQFGPLDQGWWPDGLHTPPSYEAMIFDIQYVKDLGMNFIRKHIKVEPDTYYWAAANIGVLVMQDMPALSDARKPNAEQQTEWERQLEVLFKSLMGFPAITSFVIYNEGWGQLSSGPEVYLAPRVAEWLQGHQLVNAVSGWNDYGQINGTSVGDFHDNHHYSSPQCGTPFSSLASLPYLGDRIGFQGEFGGVGVNTTIDHLWNDVEAIRDIPQTYEIDATVDVWNYRALRVIEELREQTEMFGACNGAVYTQTTDVEGEVNGFLTYDRAEDHVDHEKWEAAIAALYETFAASL